MLVGGGIKEWSLKEVAELDFGRNSMRPITLEVERRPRCTILGGYPIRASLIYLCVPRWNRTTSLEYREEEGFVSM